MTFETLGQAVDQAKTEFADYKAVLVEPERLEETYAFGGIPYNTNKKFDSELVTLRGKNTRKWGHLVITRLDSGRYEVVCYCL